MLDPNFWLDEELSALPAQTRLLYAGLWGLCDDNYATFPDRPEWVKAQIFPYEKADVAAMLAQLENIKKVLPFESEGKRFWYIKNFFKYQRVDKPSAPKYPRYPQPVGEDSTTTLQLLPRKISKEKLSEDKERKEKVLAAFEAFWKEYPNKTSKKKAKESWEKACKDLTGPSNIDDFSSAVMLGLAKAKKSPQWTKDGGRFIPHPTTWINQERWYDEGVAGGSGEKKTHKI